MLIQQMHTERLVHVFEYQQRPNVRPVAVWALGEGVDAEYPIFRTNAERQRDYRKRMSADDRDFLKARRRQRSRTIKIDPLIAAFFGVKKG